MANRTISLITYATDGTLNTSVTPTVSVSYAGASASALTPTSNGSYYNVTIDDTQDATLLISGSGLATDHLVFPRIPADTIWAHSTRAITDKAGFSLSVPPLDAAGTRTAIGLASANLDSQLASLSSAVVSGVPQASIATASTLTTGTLISGTFADTFLDNGVYLVTAPVTPAVSGFGLDRTIDYNLSTNAPFSVSLNGRFTSGVGRTVVVSIWNQTDGVWDVLSGLGMANSATDIAYTATILPVHSNAGIARLRFTSTSTNTGDRLYIDQAVVNAVAPAASAEQIAEAVNLRMKYVAYDGAIWIDTIGGIAGTTVGTNGTPTSPVSNLADAHILASALGVKRFCFMPDSTVTLTQAMDYWSLCGHAYIDLGGQSINDTQFEGCHITGISVGNDARFEGCDFMGSTSLGEFTAYDCTLSGTITLLGGSSTMLGCASGIPGLTTPRIIFTPTAYLGLRNYSGGVQVEQMTATERLSVEGQGQLKIAADCTGGVIAIRGCFTVTDSVSGGFAGTISDAARFAEDQSIVASNMRGTDSAMLAASYTAPDNLGITTANSKIDALNDIAPADVWTYTTRELTSSGASGATAAEVWTYGTRALTDKVGFSGTATNMRGTDNAMLAASFVAPDNASVAAIKAKTDNLPTDPADQSLITASIAALNDLTAAEVTAAVEASSITVDQTAVLGAISAVPASVDAALTASHGTGLWGAALETWVVLTEATLDDEGDPLAIVDAADVLITAYIGSLPIAACRTQGDGQFSMLVPPGATYTLTVARPGYDYPERVVTV